MKVILLAFSLLCGVAYALSVGDVGSTYQFQNTPSNPDIAEWASAGVEGGIPATVGAGHEIFLPLGATSADFAAAIQLLVDQGGGILNLAAGEYFLTRRLDLFADNIIIRGSADHRTLLTSLYTPTSDRSHNRIIEIQGDFVGLENLTIQSKYAKDLLSQYPSLYRVLNDYLPIGVSAAEIEAQLSINAAGATSIYLQANNAWVQNCRILFSIANPIWINRGSHITMRNNVIQDALNKGGAGHGYYGISTESHHVLIYNEKITGIRHFSVQEGAYNNVILDNYLEVDINFHDNGAHNNLVEGNIVNLPSHHQWPAFEIGDSDQHTLPGSGNLFYNNHTMITRNGAIYSQNGTVTWKNASSVDDAKFQYDNPDKVYALRYDEFGVCNLTSNSNHYCVKNTGAICDSTSLFSTCTTPKSKSDECKYMDDGDTIKGNCINMTVECAKSNLWCKISSRKSNILVDATISNPIPINGSFYYSNGLREAVGVFPQSGNIRYKWNNTVHFGGPAYNQ